MTTVYVRPSVRLYHSSVRRVVLINRVTSSFLIWVLVSAPTSDVTGRHIDAPQPNPATKQKRISVHSI